MNGNHSITAAVGITLSQILSNTLVPNVHDIRHFRLGGLQCKDIMMTTELTRCNAMWHMDEPEDSCGL